MTDECQIYGNYQFLNSFIAILPILSASENVRLVISRSRTKFLKKIPQKLYFIFYGLKIHENLPKIPAPPKKKNSKDKGRKNHFSISARKEYF